MSVGSRAAHDVVFADIVQDGKLGKLIRAEVVLEICDAKGKQAAVAKLRKARLDQIIDQRLKQGPIGGVNDTDEQKAIQFASFLSALDSLQMGYAIGYQEMATNMAGISKSMRDSMCKAYGKAADSVLFGDG